MTPFELCSIHKTDLEYTNSITFAVPFEVVCPIPEKPYGGTIEISYIPGYVGEVCTLIEWNSFGKWLESLRSDSFMAESLAEHVLLTVVRVAKPRYLRVNLSVSSSFHFPVKIVCMYEEEERIT